MPTNTHLIQRLTAIQQALMAQHTAGHQLPSAMAGSERETFLREFLQKVFPAHRRFSTGAITDSKGSISGQVDIAVEFGFAPSFPMPFTDERLLLAESVALVIEVKSDLSGQWDQVCDSVKKIKSLKRELKATLTIGHRPGPQIPYVAVGYTGHSTIDGLTKRLNSTPIEERPDAALVIKSGCFDGFGTRTSGPLGLYALCMGIDSELLKLGLVAPNLIAYIETKNEP